MNNYSQKIRTLLCELSIGLYEREEHLKLILLSMFAGKSIFLYGPPGTAKSLIAKRASMAFSVNEDKNKKFFSYLMNRFSTPEEIFGPIDIAKLKQNQLKRNTSGYLPTAYFCFLDEIWKSSPAILNTLLTIINERTYQDGNDNIKVPLKGIVCASNEFPKADQGLEALYDRMLVRLCVYPMRERENFEKLLRKKQEEKLKISDTFSIQELEEIATLSQEVDFSKEALDTLHFIKIRLQEGRGDENENSGGIYVSDRRWGQMAELVKTSVFLSGREEIIPSDLLLLKHCLWGKLEDRENIEKIFEEALQNFAPAKENEYVQVRKEYLNFKADSDKTFYKSDGSFDRNVTLGTKNLYLKQCDQMADDISKIVEKLKDEKLLLSSKNQNLFIPQEDFNVAFLGIDEQISKYTQLQLKIQELKYNIENQKDFLKQKKVQEAKGFKTAIEEPKSEADKIQNQIDEILNKRGIVYGGLLGNIADKFR
ncbi:AAA family ATPase [Helicobacter brantae]|uniref:ATPase n=1 Tax=Helicobacter brantae TaxID=375927 RepID=A0A3D8J3J5_9HELI|nr:AAA family ATPase [Helicobacter brantae]RDU71820.1 hypothetical protein CQA58_01905 [Helicobacter brantae]